MTGETTFKKLSGDLPTYLVNFGGVEFLVIQLKGFKTVDLGAILSQIMVGIKGKKAESSDFLILVKDQNQITQPYDVWANRFAQEISNVTGSGVNTISVASNATPASGAVSIGVRGSAEVKKVEKTENEEQVKKK
jgi:hypothetical protein